MYAQTQDDVPPAPDRVRGAGAGAGGDSVFVGSLDLTIVSAFLPEIIIKLESPVQRPTDDAAWVVTGYLLAYTISMTFMGRVSDLVGGGGAPISPA